MLILFDVFIIIMFALEIDAQRYNSFCMEIANGINNRIVTNNNKLEDLCIVIRMQISNFQCCVQLQISNNTVSISVHSSYV